MNMAFLGTQIYATNDKNVVTPATARTGISTVNDWLNAVSLDRNFHTYNAIMATDTKKAASQIRRCQKRVNANGFMLPPTFTIYRYYDDYGLFLQVAPESSYSFCEKSYNL